MIKYLVRNYDDIPVNRFLPATDYEKTQKEFKKKDILVKYIRIPLIIGSIIYGIFELNTHINNKNNNYINQENSYNYQDDNSSTMIATNTYGLEKLL